MAAEQSADPYRLPRSVVPSHYDLVLEPDLAAGDFTGTVVVAASVTETVGDVVLNAAEIEITAASIDTASGPLDANVSYEADAERATLTLPRPLDTGDIKIRLSFRGILNDKLRGFYRSTFVDSEGTTRTLATTQFESTDARRAFPCWDEPDFKATFGVTLVVPEDLLAISNGAEVERSATADGRVRVRFADTMKMSTYLVAFVVGPLEATEAVDVDGTPLRVVHPLGKAKLARFALDIGASALRYFSGYYGIPYPGDKVDLVAIPDFAFGAMENLGCITFRETALLVDPDVATQPELERVADVVAHELAHMWFGDLVTMRWWNGIWLNEAFATFMEVLAVDQFRPEWERWTTFALSRSAAFDTDSLASTRPIEFEVVSPADAEGMFDVLTYEKGCSVVRMLQQYLGEEPFRRGIADYLRRHAYGNTETTDLWEALEASTGQPVPRIADSWIFQPGHPVVTAELAADRCGVRLSQQGFRFLGDYPHVTWSVPLLLRWRDDDGEHSDEILLDDSSQDVNLGPNVAWLVVNRANSGFFRTRYSTELREALAGNAGEILTPVERYALLDDLWALVLAGIEPAESVLALLRAFAGETDLAVWRRMIGTLSVLSRIAPPEAEAPFARFAEQLLRPALERVGESPAADDDQRVATLRAALFEALGTIGCDKAVAQRSAAIVAGDEAVQADAALRDAAVRVVAASADTATFDDYLARSRTATTPQDALRFLGALADVEDEALFARFCELLISDEVRSQDAGLLLSRALTNRSNGPAAFRFATAHWDALLERLPNNAISRMMAGVRTFTDPDVAAEVESFLAEHVAAQANKQFAQHVERMKVSVALAERESGRISQSL